MTRMILTDVLAPGDPIDRSRDATMQLAIDEAILLMADAGDFPDDSQFLRVWEFTSPTIVLGRSSKVDLETNREFCEKASIPIYRRASGGATVMGGPGCLMYSLILNTQTQPHLKRIDQAHAHVMERVLAAIKLQVPNAQWQGTCDLTIGDQKFSGNSLRVARDHLLYHGTILYDYDLNLIPRCLSFAPRQPKYRRKRGHREFISNIPLVPEQLAIDLAGTFSADSSCSIDYFLSRAHDLVDEKYSLDAWRDRH